MGAVLPQWVSGKCKGNCGVVSTEFKILAFQPIFGKGGSPQCGGQMSFSLEGVHKGGGYKGLASCRHQTVFIWLWYWSQWFLSVMQQPETEQQW